MLVVELTLEQAVLVALVEQVVLVAAMVLQAATETLVLQATRAQTEIVQAVLVDQVDQVDHQVVRLANILEA